MSKYVRYEELKNKLKGNPMTIGISTQMDILVDRYGEEYIEIAEKLFAMIESLGYDTLAQAKHYMLDYIKGMMKFLKTGSYSNGTYEEIQSAVYDNEKTMNDVYLPGLILAHAVTILVYTKCNLFFKHFIPRLKEGGVGVDVGFGEGFYIWQILERVAGTKCIGYDISKHSLEFAPRVFDIAGIDKARYNLSLGDIRKGLPLEDNSMDFAVIAEVIEHIDGPDEALKELGRVIKKDGVLFLSTVKDSNHMDHITNFPSSEYVEEMLNNAGFKVVEKSIQRNQDDFPESQDISVGLSYVCVRI